MILQKILRFAEEDLARVELEIRQQLSSEVDRIGEIGRYLLLMAASAFVPSCYSLLRSWPGMPVSASFPCRP